MWDQSEARKIQEIQNKMNQEMSIYNDSAMGIWNALQGGTNVVYPKVKVHKTKDMSWAEGHICPVCSTLVKVSIVNPLSYENLQILCACGVEVFESDLTFDPGLNMDHEHKKALAKFMEDKKAEANAKGIKQTGPDLSSEEQRRKVAAFFS